VSQAENLVARIKDFLKRIAPEKKSLRSIRSLPRKQGANKLSLREIHREIRAYRRERSF